MTPLPASGGEEAPRRGEVGEEERVARRQQAVEVADVRLVVADEVEVPAGRQVVVDERVLLVGDPPQVELAVEADEDAVVEPGREPRGGEGDLGGALALRAGGADRGWAGRRPAARPPRCPTSLPVRYSM